MQILDLPVDKLVPDPNNARLHDEKNLDAIKGSLAKFGQQHPIIIDEKNIVLAGNGRLEAAKSLGWQKIKCVRSSLTTSTDKTAFKIADNRTGELASWDDEILGKELVSLKDDGFDIGDIGFDEDFLGDDEEPEGKPTPTKDDSCYTCPSCGEDLPDVRRR